MRRHGYALAAVLCTALALGACSSARVGGLGWAPDRSAANTPDLYPPPVEAVPSGPVEASPLPPIDGEPMEPFAGTPAAPGAGPSPSDPDVAALPPPPPPPTATAPVSRTSMVGGWTARVASGGTCRVQLSSSPALDLYRASTSGCSNQDLSKINAWDFRDGEVYLYQTGGSVAARLRGSSSSLSGVLAKSGAPLTLAR